MKIHKDRENDRDKKRERENGRGRLHPCPAATLPRARISPAKALLALLLVVPAPGLGVLAGMVWWPGAPFGRGVFVLLKAWILMMPVLWWWRMERQSTPGPLRGATRRQWMEGAVSGLGIAAVILGGYGWLGTRWIDAAAVRNVLHSFGLDSPGRYLAAAAYWCTINAWLEEYFWRWFVAGRFRVLCSREKAVVFSAIAFALHHVGAMILFLPPAAVVVATAGVIAGGIVWAALVLRHGSLWPAFLSHLLADVVIFGIGFHLLLAGR